MDAAKEPQAGTTDPRRPWTAAHFLTYSNDRSPFERNARAYCDSARSAGFATALHRHEDWLRDTPFWAANSGILEQPRGAGYWLWKPYIIRERLLELSKGDVLLYSDAGRGIADQATFFDGMPEVLLKLACLSPMGFLAGWSANWAAQARYTKPDCFHLLGADTARMWNAPQLGATWSVWTPSPQAFKFLGRWLKACRDPRILTDQPDACGAEAQPDYKEHRHDQAVFSIIAHQMRAPHLQVFDPPAKIAIQAEKVRVANPADFLKRVGNVDRVLARLVPRGFMDDPDPGAIAGCEPVIGYLDPRKPVPDLSEKRGGATPHEQLAEFVHHVKTAPDRVTWSGFHAAMPRAARMLLRKINQTRERAEIEALREVLVSDLRARLPLEDATRGTELQRLRALCQDCVLALAQRLGVDTAETQWNKLWRQMPAEARRNWSWLFPHLPPREVLPLRDRLSIKFVKLLGDQGTEEAAYQVMAPALDRLHAKLIAQQSPDAIFPRWWALWQQMDPPAREAWCDATFGMKSHLLVECQERLVQTLGTTAPQDWAAAIQGSLYPTSSSAA